MPRKSIVLFAVLLNVLNPFNDSSCEASSGGAAAAISITSGTVIGGATLFLIVRNNRRANASADSVIAIVDSQWRHTNKFYDNGDYREAANTADSIQQVWDRYFEALARKRKKDFIGKDSLLTIIHLSQLRQKHSKSLASLQQVSARLPTNQDQLLSWNRHGLTQLLDSLQKTVGDTISNYNDDNAAVMMIYHPIIAAVKKVDSLFKKVYDSERLDFSVKNRFFYNRMIEQNSLDALQHFVDDCDYYNVDKEWCERARLTLNSPVKSDTDPLADSSKLPPAKKPTSIDTMNALFEQAITSRNIELLQNYLTKYSGIKFRKVARLDSVRTVLEIVRKELLREQIFSREHPRISDISSDKLTVSIAGLPPDIEHTVGTLIDTLRSEFSAMTFIRFPATLSIDYTSRPPLFLLSGYVHKSKDIIFNDSLSERRYTIQGAKQGFILLDKIARQCSAVVPVHINTFVHAPAYAVRFIKNGETYLTMYGSGKKNSGIELYNFFDISIPGHQNIRTPYSPEENVIRLLTVSDTTKALLGKQFFENY